MTFNLYKIPTYHFSSTFTWKPELHKNAVINNIEKVGSFFLSLLTSKVYPFLFQWGNKIYLSHGIKM